jgi:hydroxyacylglutathione hydrolase
VLELRNLAVSEFESNCYLLVAPQSQQGILIDAGDQQEDILRWVGSVQLTHILITHGHHDHVGALEVVRRTVDASVGIHPADAETYGLQADFPLLPGIEFQLGDDRIEVEHVPGHTPGSVVLRLFEAGKVSRAIVGDAIFPGGPGYTEKAQDLATSLESLARTVFAWPDETILFPGHGGPTTVGAERVAFEVFRERPIRSDLCGDVTWR